ncbi:MAG: FAD-dependent oxidoreductase, partial [Parachlamydia sp.]|nr:FAD-dependent oxidoreductase [Parachlamydia sp.]
KVGEHQVEAESIILATGSEPTPLPFLSFDEKVVLSSTGAVSLSRIPKTMLIIGAGVIGVELASVWQRLGCQVTLVEMLDQICAGVDAAISKNLLSILKKQGLTFHLGAKVLRADVKQDGATVVASIDNQEQVFNTDVVLVAVGRRPYSRGLNLAGIGIQANQKGFIPVDSNFRTAVPHIYAIGDLIDGPMLAHKASAEGAAVAEILKGQTPKINYLAIPNVIYTHPEAASVGMTEKEARDAGLELIIGTSWMRGNPRARCAGDLEGLVKVIGEKKSGRLVGLHIISAHASEMIGQGLMAIEKGATVEDLAISAQAHPTLNEAIKEAAGSAIGHAIHQ